MKITDMEAAPLNLTPKMALTVAYGSYPTFEYALIKIHTKEGGVGLGEASPDPAVTGETQIQTIQVLKAIREQLIHQNPFNRRSIMTQLRQAFPESPAALAAVDMALFDLMGQHLGVPVYDLLGGKARRAISITPVIPLEKPEMMAQMAKTFIQMGSQSLKIKLGTDPGEDLIRVQAISKAIGPEIALRPDINQGWRDANTALKALEMLSGFNLEWVEQPLPAEDFEGMACLCRHSDIPIMADESCHTAQDALRLINMKAADILNIKLMKCGGLQAAEEILAVANAADVPCVLGSMGESGIGSAAGLHLMAAHPEITACDLIGPLFLENDPSVGYEADLENNQILIPEKPGLGVVLQ
jgi:L-alanine-DL-glutamate epimerase-like enolase superfamily enzyme